MRGTFSPTSEIGGRDPHNIVKDVFSENIVLEKISFLVLLKLYRFSQIVVFLFLFYLQSPLFFFSSKDI